MKILRTLEEATGCAGCVLVPTMGALHEGHGVLIRRASEIARGRLVVASVFVNPTQFNDPSDLAKYPRTLDTDAVLAERAGAGVVFAPSDASVYPEGREVRVPALPEVATAPGLEDAWRPGHFAGVCQVVARFFEMLRPSAALFGEKDWQQLQVVRAMASRDFPGLEIVPVETVREQDGLAMSSRNARLGGVERARASAVSRALCEACAEKSVSGAEGRMRGVLEDAGLEVEYCVVRDGLSLMPLGAGASDGRALIAARCGGVRLIDNAPWRARG